MYSALDFCSRKRRRNSEMALPGEGFIEHKAPSDFAAGLLS
jgi:hypothetical protein